MKRLGQTANLDNIQSDLGDSSPKSVLARILEAVEQWWWPGVVVVYVLAFVPTGRNDYVSAVAIRYLVMGIGVLGGAVQEVTAWRPVTIGSAILRALRLPAVGIACMFGILALVSALVSEDFVIGLTGSLTFLDEGALAALLFVAAFVLVYVRRHRDAGLDRRLATGFLVLGVISAVWATAEAVVGRGFVLTTRAVPIVVSLSPGLLAGTLLFVIAVAVAYQGVRTSPAIITALMAAFALGLTLNRTSILVLALFVVYWLFRERSLGRSLLVGATIIAALTGYASISALSAARGDVFRTDALSGNTLGTRITMWRIGIDGIADRPLVGWGGADQFMNAWTTVTSPELALDLLRREEGITELLGVSEIEGQQPVLTVRFPDGTVGPSRLLKLKVHNQILDVAVMWGVPAAIALLALVLLVLRNAWNGSPLAVGVTVYFSYAMLWYIPLGFEGAFWIALAGAQPLLSWTKPNLSESDATSMLLAEEKPNGP